MSVSFLFYTHTDNSDIWPYIEETASNFRYKYSKFIAVNETNKTFSTFTKTLFYDDSKSYDEKLHHLLNQITTDYVVLIHDNDLIVEFDNDLFEILVQKIHEINIDRLVFGVAAKTGPNILQLTESDAICKINNLESRHFLLPYDVGPSIWKVKSYIEALKTSPNTSYRDIEFSPVRDYCISNLNIYGFISHKSIMSYYVVGRPFYYKFQFLHIFTRRQLMYPKMYMDQEENLIKILEKYPEILKRGFLDHLIDIYLRTV